MFTERYNFILSVSLLSLSLGSLSHASNDPIADEQNPIKSSQQQALTREEILDLTPRDPELVALANSGNLEAMNRLGTCLVLGLDCARNVNTAFKLFTAAAKRDHPAALLNLAGALFKGDGCVKSEQNDRLAVSCLKRAGELGRIDAKYHYADCLLYGKGCDKTLANQDLAWKLFREMADTGHGDSMYMIGIGFLENGNRTLREQQEGVKWLEKAVKVGHVEALGKLGSCYLMEIGCVRDNQKAFKYLKEAADKGHVSSMQNLSLCLQSGLGCERTPENEKLAIANYIRLAEKGYPAAMLSLALAYDQGQGVSQDTEKARYWYEQAVAKAPEPSNRYLIALLYFHNKEYDLALPHFEKIKGQYRVGEFLGYIYFRKRHYENALINYQDASKRGTEGHWNIAEKQISEAKVINPALLDYLNKRVAEAKAIGQPMPKSETTNVPQQLALAAQEDHFRTLHAQAIDLNNSLVKRLTNVSGSPEFNATQELENLNKIYKIATGDLESLTLAKKLERIKKLTEFMSALEGRLLVYEQRVESHKKVISIRAKVLQEQQRPAHEDLETAKDRNLQKETKSAATKALQEEKDLRHKKTTRKHAPLPKGKSIAQPTEKSEIKAEKQMGPFSEIKKPKRRTQADIPDAAWNKVYVIRDILRDAISMDAAIGLLDKLEGGFKFTKIDPDYAGVPNDCIAYEMRINDQFRVIIAFQPSIIREYEASTGIQNNNNAIEKTVYKLYGGTIYVDDPHK